MDLAVEPGLLWKSCATQQVQEGFVNICNSSSERTRAHALKQCHRYC